MARSCKSWRDEYNDGISERILLPTPPHRCPVGTSFPELEGDEITPFQHEDLTECCSSVLSLLCTCLTSPRQTHIFPVSGLPWHGPSAASLCKSRKSERSLPVQPLDVLTEELWGEAQELPIQPGTFSNNLLSGESTQVQPQLSWVCRWFDLCFKKKWQLFCSFTPAEYCSFMLSRCAGGKIIFHDSKARRTTETLSS